MLLSVSDYFCSLVALVKCISCLSRASVVDSILDPENRLHMSVEEQLKELLDKLDFVSSMRCSGARTRRIRLLRREINHIRYRQGQHRNSLHNGHLKVDTDEDDEEDEDKASRAENGLSSEKGGSRGG